MSFEMLHSEPTEIESISRYLFDRGHFAVTTGRVKPRALEPANKYECTSVGRTIDLTNEQVWQLGQIYADLRDDRLPILGRADFTVLDVLQADLSIISDEPPARHANITGWPPLATTEKHVIMDIAQKMARKATLRLIPGQTDI